MDVPHFVPRELQHILLKGDEYHVIDDESWKPKYADRQFHFARYILDHDHWITNCSLSSYNLGHGLSLLYLRRGIIFEDKCIYCEAAEHEIPFQKIQDVCHLSVHEWIKELECLWREYCEAGANIKPAKQ